MPPQRSAGEATAVASPLVLLSAAILYPLLQALACLGGRRPTARPLFREALLSTPPAARPGG